MLKVASRVGSSETAIRCSALQMLLAGADRELVCKALAVTDRALRKWTQLFNRSGFDGIIVDKRPGRMSIIRGDQAHTFSCLIEKPEQVGRTFWTAKAFHGYISETYHVECSYETIVRFFHKEGFAMKVPQPWSDRQDEALRESFCKTLNACTLIHVWISGSQMNQALKGIPVQGNDGTKKAIKPGSQKMGAICG